MFLNEGIYNCNIMITKNMNIKDVITKFPETLDVFKKYGFHCIGCIAASFESIWDAAKVHGVDIDVLIKELNKCVLNNKCGTGEKEI